MGHDGTTLLANYLKQQIELGMPDIILSRPVTPSETLGGALSDPETAAREALGSAETEGPNTYAEKRTALHALYHSVKQCRRCPLGATRNHFVFGAGTAAAPLMVIGEAPGEEEDGQGLPFVGAAGTLLTNMLAAIKLDRTKDVFITNILKCRPPGNRNPESAETLSCAPILTRQIEIVRPQALLLLGRIAAHEILKTSLSVSTLRTQRHAYRDIPAVVTYHPAALLRNGRYKPAAWEDLKKVKALLENLGAYERRTGI